MGELTEKDVIERSGIYKKKKSGIISVIGLVCVMLVYLFFFTSNITLPNKITDKYSVSQIGREVAFAEQRYATLVSANYSDEQQMMELVLYYSNQNYDNINDYYYALDLTGASTKKVEIDEVFHEDLVTVLRITNLPADYEEMYLYFAPKTKPLNEVTDDITGELILNKHNVVLQDHIQEKTRTDYLIERLDSVISDYEKKIVKQEEKLKEIQNRIQALESENESISKNKNYMTDKEIAEKEETIRVNEEELIEVREEENKQKQLVDSTKSEIKKAKNKRSELKQ